MRQFGSSRKQFLRVHFARRRDLSYKVALEFRVYLVFPPYRGKASVYAHNRKLNVGAGGEMACANSGPRSKPVHSLKFQEVFFQNSCVYIAINIKLLQ